MTSLSSINSKNSVTKNQSIEFKKSQSQPEIYNKLLSTSLEELIDQTKQLAQSKEDHLQEIDNDKQGDAENVKSLKEKEIIKNGPIFLAILVVLFTGESSVYRVLATKMADLNGLMKKVGQFTDKIKDLQDEINKLMKGPENPEEVALRIAQYQKELNELVEKQGDAIGDSLLEKIKGFSSSKSGSLDQIINEATLGKYNRWDQISSDDDALKKVQSYLSGQGAGGAPEGVSTVTQNMSSLLGALNTQNQAHLEKLNMVTKKVDAATKLFASAISLFKGLTQTLTQYSGS